MEDLLEPFSPEEVERRRLAREEKCLAAKKKESLGIARRFEEGISVFSPADEDGRRRMSRERFLEVLSLDLEGTMNDEQYSPEEASLLRKSLSKSVCSSGVALALSCPGRDTCSFSEKCPFAGMAHEPAGRTCPLEQVLFTEFLVRYLETFNVDPTNIVELQFCNELAETEILIMRMNKLLSKPENSRAVMASVNMVRGVAISTVEISPYLEAREQLVRRRERVVQLMVGDRREQYKKQAALRKKDSTDESDRHASTASRIMDARLAASLIAEKKATTTPEDILNTPDDQ